MTQDKALLLNLTKREESAQVLPQAPIMSSQHVGWNGIFLAHYRQPAHETPEHRVTQHVIAITDVRTQTQSERRLDGRLQRYLFGNGQISLTPANVSHWGAWDNEGEFTMLTICPRFVERVARESVNAERVELVPQFAVVDPLIQQVGLALKADVETGCVTGRLYGESAATMLAVHLLKHYAVFTPVLPTYTGGLCKHRLQQALAYINDHLDQDIKLADIANAVGMSQYYFIRLFKQSIGMTPHQYIIRQRVERAKQLLKQRDLAISDIALKCGFANQTHLTKLFRQFTGITPKVYRLR